MVNTLRAPCKPRSSYYSRCAWETVPAPLKGLQNALNKCGDGCKYRVWPENNAWLQCRQQQRPCFITTNCRCNEIIVYCLPFRGLPTFVLDSLDKQRRHQTPEVRQNARKHVRAAQARRPDSQRLKWTELRCRRISKGRDTKSKHPLWKPVRRTRNTESILPQIRMHKPSR